MSQAESPLPPILPDRLAKAIEAELELGEQLQWAGTPRPTFFTPRSVTQLVAGVVWTGFMAGAVRLMAEKEAAASLLQAPILAIGVSLISGPIWAYRRSRRIAYVVTDRRAFTIEQGRRLTVRSFAPDDLVDLYRRENRDGSGDVVIDHPEWNDPGRRSNFEECGFLRVADVRGVERRLKRLAAEKGRRENSLSSQGRSAENESMRRQDAQLLGEHAPSVRLQGLVAAELDADESIVWIGSPRPVFFMRRGRETCLVGIVITCCLAFVWTIDPPGFAYFLLGFFWIAGIVMAASPMWTYWTSVRTAYVVTDRRAIVLENGWRLVVRSYLPEKLRDLKRRDGDDGWGDLIFQRRTWKDSEGTKQEEEFGFFRVAAVREVEEKLDRLAQAGLRG